MWFQTDKPLKDGWYWRKSAITDITPICIHVVNNLYIDLVPVDNENSIYQLIGFQDFRYWWWNGPIKKPVEEQHIAAINIEPFSIKPKYINVGWDITMKSNLF